MVDFMERNKIGDVVIWSKESFWWSPSTIFVGLLAVIHLDRD